MPDRRPRFLLPSRRPAPGGKAPHVEAPEVSMEARPEDVAAPVEQSMVDAGVYVDGARVASPTTVAETAARAPRDAGRDGLDRPVPARRTPSSGPSPRSSACTRSRSRTRSSPTSGRSSSATATRCSSSSAPRRTSTTTRRSSSARSTSSSGRTSCSPCATAGRPTSAPSGSAWRASPELLALGPGGGPVRDPRQRRRRLRAGRRRASRRTSTRSRPRSSAATRRCRGASTSCPAR